MGRPFLTLLASRLEYVEPMKYGDTFENKSSSSSEVAHTIIAYTDQDQKKDIQSTTNHGLPSL